MLHLLMKNRVGSNLRGKAFNWARGEAWVTLLEIKQCLRVYTNFIKKKMKAANQPMPTSNLDYSVEFSALRSMSVNLGDFSLLR